MIQQLDNNQLARIAPSIFAANASANVSSKYSFFPTIDVVDSLRNEGWFPVRANQSRTRLEEKRGYQKHKISFRRDSHFGQNKVGDCFPELVLINSHDGASSYQLHAGIFRLVCTNGLTVSDSLFQKICVKHVGFKKDDVIEASYRVLENLPQVMGSVESMKATQLNRAEQLLFAEQALAIRYDGEPIPVSPDRILRARRYDDQGGDLWKTLNIVQENTIKGGVRGMVKDKDGRVKHIMTRKVGSIDKDTALNKALWTLAERMKELKAA